MTISEAADRIDEFYHRCTIRLGDPFAAALTEKDLQWIEAQSESWPYGEPNLFRYFKVAMVEHLTTGAEGVVLPWQKPDLLEKLFNFPKAEIEKYVKLCPCCGQPL